MAASWGCTIHQSPNLSMKQTRPFVARFDFGFWRRRALGICLTKQLLAALSIEISAFCFTGKYYNSLDYYKVISRDPLTALELGEHETCCLSKGLYWSLYLLCAPPPSPRPFKESTSPILREKYKKGFAWLGGGNTWYRPASPVAYCYLMDDSLELPLSSRNWD